MSEVKKHKKPSLQFAVLTLLVIVAFMATGLIIFKIKLNTLMFLSWLLMVPFAMKLGFSFEELEDGAYSMIKKGLQAMIIIMAVGALIGAWIASGTVPTLIYIGLKIISPKFFLVTTLFFCAIISSATGTSWGSMGTAGIAMMAVGEGMGIPAGMTAGAVISGAYFGDKMSPLSDSTNLAPAVAGTDVITHIKHMTYTTGPSFIISAILFTILGLKYGVASVDLQLVTEILAGLSGIFKISWIALIPTILVIYLLIRGHSPVTSILSGAVLGALFAIFYQGTTLGLAASAMWGGYKGEFELTFMNKLLNRGGIESMQGIVSLMMFGLGLGGMMRITGILETLLAGISKKIKSDGGLVFITVLVSYLSNAIGASMAFGAVLTGTLMSPLFEEHKLKPENLSRIIEDAGTLGAVMIPWTTNAVYTMQVLQVSYLAYLPFCFLNILNPIISIIYGVTGFSMTKYTDEEIALKLEEAKV